MPRAVSDEDPRGLILESYRIEGIGPEDCRSIFFDWALGLPAERDMRAAAATLLALYEPAFPEHPMTAVLREALSDAQKPARRGGRAAKRGAPGSDYP